MFDRRGFLQIMMATAALCAPGSVGRAAAAQKISQKDLLRFEPLGRITLLHFSDIHGQLMPVYFREPSINIGVGAVRGLPPHVTGRKLLDLYGIPAGSPEAYMLTSEDFVALSRNYGRIGGLDRMATLIKAIRAERPGKTILLDGGDTWQGSYTSLKTRGADMVKAMNALGVEAMTAHWEFTYGAERVMELIDQLEFPFLAGNVRDTSWDEPVFEAVKIFERAGLRIAVIGQAYPYTPIANPRYLIPDWSFGIREDQIRERVNAVRAAGVDLVVLLSHNGFDVDRKLASRVKGIDVIFTAHTHDALPQATTVGNTLLVASGSHGKFLSRLDLDVRGRRVAAYRYKLIPVFADVIDPDPAMAALIKEVRAPYEAEVNRVLGRTESLLYRRGNFNGTFDDLICQALLEERDAQIALSPGFRWGATLLPGQDIRVEDVFNQTAITYPNAYRSDFTGAFLKEILESVADNLFHPDPYYQQGGDMVRVGNLSYTIHVSNKIGSRISDMTLIDTGEKIDAGKTYVVSGWASVNEGTQGPPVHDVVSRYIERHKSVRIPENRQVKVIGA
ncbi:MAG: thiosulfohydrolase SoxB [Proteobacteria bacterium]|nr:thiosulfohydrolase SoxB [Pseudomonadota bacterium]